MRHSNFLGVVQLITGVALAAFNIGIITAGHLPAPSQRTWATQSMGLTVAGFLVAIGVVSLVVRAR